MKHNRRIIYIAGFLFSIPIALTSYVNSSLLGLYIDQYYIALLYIVASVGTIGVLFSMTRLLTFFGNRKLTIIASIVSLISFLILGLSENAVALMLAFILYFISFNIIFFCLDIFIEDFSKNSPIGGIRGLYLSITSIAWVITQVISGSVILKGSLPGVYLLSVLFILLIIGMFSVFFRDFKDVHYKKISFIKGIKLCLKSDNITRIYVINFILKFFYAWMVIYMPLYLHQYIGFTWGEIGIIFSIMLIPFVVIEFPLGKLSDRIGEKKMLITGFVIITASTIAISFFILPKLALWALILFLTRVGAAMIEIMSESYFFKLMNEKDAELVGFFRNTTPLSYIVAPLLAIPILYFTSSIMYIFTTLVAVLLIGLFVSLRLRDVK